MSTHGLNAGTAQGGNSVYLDGGFAMGRGLLRDNPYWSEATGFSRGLSRFEYDEPGSLQRWTVGDQTASSSDGLGGSALLGGIGVARAFDLNPYLITYPQPVFNGVLQAPGTIDIYQNGVLIGQRQVPAGPFSLAEPRDRGQGPTTCEWSSRIRSAAPPSCSRISTAPLRCWRRASATIHTRSAPSAPQRSPTAIFPAAPCCSRARTTASAIRSRRAIGSRRKTVW